MLIAKVMSTARKLETDMARVLAKYGLTPSQYNALCILAENGGTLNVGELAARMGCSRGNLTGVTDRLERDGWITRDRCADDRRMVAVRLLDVADRLAKVRAAVAEWEKGLLADLHIDSVSMAKACSVLDSLAG